jgi:hypothetical protein
VRRSRGCRSVLRKAIFPLHKVILDAPHLSFQQLLGSHVWVLCFSAAPPGCCHTYSSSIEFA